MKKKQFIFLIGTIIILTIGFNTNAQDAVEILKKMDDIMFSPKDITARQKITLINHRNQREEVREAVILQKGNSHRLFRFTSPASQAGIAVLSLPDDIMYLYLPSFGRERRIAASAKNQNFAGTDFTYDDMETVPFVEKYNPKLLRTENNTYVIELIPKGRSEYSKVIAYVNKTHHYPEKMEFYDRGNNKIKEAEYIFEKAGKYWNSKKIEMKDLRKNHTTRMEMFDVKYDSGLTEDDFTLRRLKE